MFPKEKRLNTALFKEVMTSGKAFHSSFFTLKVLKKDSKSLFSVSVSKKVAKSAVLRNKIRRRIYSVIRSIENKIKDGFYIILIAKEPTKTDFEIIKEEVNNIFVKSGLLK